LKHTENEGRSEIKAKEKYKTKNRENDEMKGKYKN
jgi:hypothetical protein